MIVDPQKTPAGEVYRLMIRTIIPRPIAWVSTVSQDGVANIAPFSFFTAVTADPPTICFAPARRPGGAKKDTLANVEASGEFVVNVVTRSLALAMNETATDFPPEIDEFQRAGLTAVPSTIVAPPRIGESPIQMECRLEKVVPVGRGSGVLVLGEIVLFHVSETVLDADGKVDPSLLEPVGRLGGMDYAALGERLRIPRKSYDPHSG